MEPGLKPGFIALIITLLFGSPVVLKAQNYNQSPQFLKANSKWTMGKRGGLDFSSGPPLPFVSDFNFNFSNYYPPVLAYSGVVEGAVSVADPVTGDLLFNTGGPFCWNANGNIMPNGDSLLGNYLSTTQGVCAVPMVDSPGKYFLFNLHGFTDGGAPGDGQGSFFYSVVDMSLDGGLGDITPGRKNILLYQKAAPEKMGEGLIAIPGNNCDIWVVIYVYRPSSSVFLSYHITQAGLDPVPVVSPTNDTSDFAYGMAVSPDRSMVALSARKLQLYRFDPNTGALSGFTSIGPGRGYVPAFSPDNTKLYYDFSVQIMQCEVGNFVSGGTVGTPVAVGSSCLVSASSIGYVYLRLYRDTIYFTETTDRDKMGIIASPNNAGTACNVVLDAITAASGTMLYVFALPNEVVYPPVIIGNQVWDTTVCFAGASPVFTLNAPPGALSQTWDNGDTTAGRQVSASGTYWVAYEGSCSSGADTFKVTLVAMDTVTNTVDVHGCDGDSVRLSVPPGGTGYLWNDGSTDTVRYVNTPGTYSVSSIRQQDCRLQIDMFKVTFVAHDTVTNTMETYACDGDSARLSATPGGTGYVWNDGTTGGERYVKTPGTYSVASVHQQDCRVQIDSFHVDIIRLDVDLGPDTAFCGPRLILDAITPGATHFLWQDQSNEPTFTVKEAGVYTVTVSREDCSDSDSILVTSDCSCVPFIPNAFTPNKDHENDVFAIKFINCPVANFNLSIYNRYGQRVFETDNPEAGWDGTFKGKLCDMDVYFYYLRYETADDQSTKRKAGDLTLVR